jgi:DNA-binding CsgD family transcriptional regulator
MILPTFFDAPAGVSDGSAMFSDRVWAVLGDTLCLTGRQRQILRAVFDDATDAAMASGLGISIRTVRSHLGHMFRKLGVADRAELVLQVVAEFIRLFGDPDAGLPAEWRSPAGARLDCQLDDRAPSPAWPWSAPRSPTWRN